MIRPVCTRSDYRSPEGLNKNLVCAMFPSASDQSFQRIPARINRRLSEAGIENARERRRYRGAGSLSSDRRKLISRRSRE